jgi:translocation and assembly module TamB
LVLQTDDALLQGPLDIQPAQRSVRGQLQLELPGAQGRLGGQLAPQDGNADLALDITDAARLATWLRRLPPWPVAWALPDLRGRADLVLHWQGGWQTLQSAKADTPRVQAVLQIPTLTLHTAGKPGTDTLEVRGARISLAGTPGALTLAASSDGTLGGRRLALQAEAQGGRMPAGDWRMSVNALKVDLRDDPRPGTWSLALRAPMLLEWLPDLAGGSLRTAAAQAQLTGPLAGVATLQLQPLVWSPGGRGSLTSQGQLSGLPMEWLARLGSAPLADLGLSGNLLFDATWDLAANDTLKARATLVRRSGDIRVLADNLPGSLDAGTAVDAGVRDARITLAVDGETLTATMRWDSERAGTARADASARLLHNADGWSWPALAPVTGSVQARLPQVGVWSVLAPPGWRMRGTLDANLVLTGSRQSPNWSGQIQADGLALRSVVDGIEFGNGRLRARMQEQRLFIEEFSLQGAGGAAGGTLTATGFALWMPAGDGPSGALSRVQIDIDATAKALRVSARADRRMVVSGAVQARLRNARLDVQGTLTADQALFVLPDETAPRLGDDVVVRGSIGDTRQASTPGSTAAARASPGLAVETTLALVLNLGPDFRVQGRGIVTRLAGTLQLRNTASEPPRLTGEVRTVRGSYKAYGQLLDIEQGVMRFTGAYDNPVLDIIAVRPNLAQRVGVQITGNVFAPRVRLFSEPELPEAEKLAWLVLGRSGANGGAEAAVLQQAAMALLGRNGQGLSGGLANALGLDELSIAGATSRADGTTAAATVTLGKRISRDFYVAYERSLAGTLGTISIFYDLSRRFTLRASTGEQSAIDLIFTIRYD